MPAIMIDQLALGGWHPRTVDIWRRAHCACEYCGKSLIASVDDYFFGSEIDHIVPSAGDDFENMALACTACNRIKRRTSFLDPGGANARHEIVARASAYIANKRERNRTRLAEVMRLLRELEAS